MRNKYGSMLDHDFLVLRLYLSLGMKSSCLYLGNSFLRGILRASRLQAKARPLAWICTKNATLPAVDPHLPLWCRVCLRVDELRDFEIGVMTLIGARSRPPITSASLQVHFTIFLQHQASLI
jgi:hypothetical protein